MYQLNLANWKVFKEPKELFSSIRASDIASEYDICDKDLEELAKIYKEVNKKYLNNILHFMFITDEDKQDRVYAFLDLNMIEKDCPMYYYQKDTPILIWTTSATYWSEDYEEYDEDNDEYYTRYDDMEYDFISFLEELYTKAYIFYKKYVWSWQGFYYVKSK